MVDTKAGADDGLSVERCGSPRDTETRIEIPVTRIVQRGISWARRSVYRRGEGRVERTRTQASTVELVEVKHRGAVGRFAGDAVIVPAKARVDRESGGYFPFVLEVRHVETTAKPVAAPRCNEVQSRQLRPYEAIVSAEIEVVIRGLSLIEANPADLNTHFEGVRAVGPSEVVDHTVGGANFNVGRLVGNTREIVGVYGEGQRT